MSVSAMPDLCKSTADGARALKFQVRPLTGTEQSAWDRFIDEHPDATLFHQRAWARAVEEGFGYKTYAFAAWQRGRLTGALPLTHIRSPLFGDALISMGHAVAGGVLAEDLLGSRALAEAAVELARNLGVRRIELRQERATPLPPPWIAKSGPYATFRREISPSDALNLKAIPRKKRADLRKALADRRLRVDVGIDLITFYSIYSRSVRNLGTPIRPRRFFDAIVSGFGDSVEISAVIAPDGPVSTVMTFWFKDRVMPYFGGALPRARKFHAYDLLYWDVMHRAAARGCKIFDFGRSKKGTGSYDYKTYWGFSPLPLAYQHLPLRGEVPDINPLNPKYRMMVATWKRLPLPIANAIGPMIARQIG